MDLIYTVHKVNCKRILQAIVFSQNSHYPDVECIR